MKTSTADLKRAAVKNRAVGLWRLMAGFRAAYIGSALTLGLAAGFRTCMFLLLGYFVDRVLGGGNFNAAVLPLFGVAFIVLASGEGLFSFYSGKLAAHTAEGITERLRNYLFDHMQRLTFAYHDKMPTGDLIQRSTSDMDAVRRFFAEQAIGVVRILLLFLINFVVLLFLNWQLALISTIVVPVIAILSLFFFRKVTKVYDDFQVEDAILSTILQENLTGVRVVKAFARQNYEQDKFQGSNWKRYQLGRKMTLMHSMFWPLGDIICGLQIVGAFFVAALFVMNHTITLGEYLTFVGLLGWVIQPIRNLGRLIVQTSTGLVSFDRLMEIIREDREPLEEGTHRPTGDVLGDIVFDHVSFEYEKETPVLHDISFHVRPGQSIALLGSTGSGKTTLVNLLPRFYEYTSGRITLDGVDLKDYPREYLRNQIGVVEQQPFLFSRTIRENITYGVKRTVSQAEVEAAARAAAVHDVIMTFPDGYNTLVGEKGVTLSGGQKQRVALARTLLKNPRILILDDATSSVDTETEGEIREALQDLMENRTTFIIAHRIQSVMNANQILVFDKGRIVQSGTHEELMAEHGIYRRIHNVQTRVELELEKEMASA